MHESLGIVAILEQSLRSNAGRTALVAGDDHWTYDRLDHESGRFANALAELDIRPGDRVLLVLGNTAEYVMALVGCLRAGVLPVPINQMLSAADVLKIASHAEPVAAIVANAHLAQLEHADTRRLVVDPGEGTLEPGDVSLAEVMAGQSSAFVSLVACPDQPAVLLYTGGTTGAPKAVVHTGLALGMNAWAQLLEAEIRRDERLVLSTPLSHAAGFFLLPALCRGAAGILLAEFSPDAVATAVSEAGGTWTYMVPTMLYRWLDSGAPERHDLGGLRTIVYGAAPVMGSRLADAVRRHGPIFIQQYGQTEVPTFATVLNKEDHQAALDGGDPRAFESAGYACAMCEVAVFDLEGRHLGPSEMGEVVVRSPYNMSGYLASPEATAEAFHGEWLRTGDLGLVDGQGRLFLLDRLKDVVISGGMNIYTREVEEDIQRFSFIREVAAFGVADSTWGERLEIAVSLRDSTDTRDPEELRRILSGELTSYKRPKQVHVLDALPTTPFGKFDKKKLRKRFGTADSLAEPEGGGPA